MTSKRKFVRKKHVTGASETAKTDANTAYEESIKSRADSIQLPVAGKQVPFHLITVPYTEILQRTQVYEGNDRFQDNLNEISVSDILPTIKEKGQQYPAIGKRDEKGNIIVLDGSRRRFSCNLAKKDFLIYVTDDFIEDEYTQFMSRIANRSKPLSLFELGAAYERMLEEGKYKDAKELAIGENVTESSVSAARNARKLPGFIVEKVPSISELGRPSINTLRNAIKENQRIGQQQALEQFIKSLNIVALKAKANSSNPQVLNKLFVSQIVEFAPKQEKKVITNKKSLELEVGQQKVYVKKSRKGYQLDLESVDETKIAGILAAIKKALKS